MPSVCSFCRPSMVGLHIYALILLLSKSSTMSDLWLHGFDSLLLYHNFFESKSWEVFKLWYLLFKEVDLVAMFVLFDLQNSSFLSFSSCEVDNFIYCSLWWLLGGCCHLYVEWSLFCLMIRFNIAFQRTYCSFMVKSLWSSLLCVMFDLDSNNVRPLSLLAFTPVCFT